MNPIKIIFPGTSVVKANTQGQSLYYTDRQGKKRLRTDGQGNVRPIHFYTAVWQDYAKTCMIQCYNFRVNHPEIDFPVSQQINLKCLFFVNDDRIRDISNLYKGIEDVLVGNSGVDVPSLPRSAYQILFDDNWRHVGSHDGSRYILDFTDPRTEITISDYVL